MQHLFALKTKTKTKANCNKNKFYIKNTDNNYKWRAPSSHFTSTRQYCLQSQSQWIFCRCNLHVIDIFFMLFLYCSFLFVVLARNIYIQHVVAIVFVVEILLITNLTLLPLLLTVTRCRRRLSMTVNSSVCCLDRFATTATTTMT